MAEVDLTQAEADELIALPKRRKDARPWAFPLGGGSIAIPLVSQDGRHEFRFDIRRAPAGRPKSRYQIRLYIQQGDSLPLLRLDIGERPHKNLDGGMAPPIHVHRYREGYVDGWAEPVPDGVFRDLADPVKVLQDFMRSCNIVQEPNIQIGVLDD